MQLLKLKAKFALASSIATLCDLVIFQILESSTGWEPEWINVISSFAGMCINFLLQKKYIFELKRNAWKVFLFSLMISMGGIALSSAIIYILTHIKFFHELPIFAKLIATGIVFFYNFYLKRYAFEKKFMN